MTSRYCSRVVALTDVVVDAVVTVASAGAVSASVHKRGVTSDPNSNWPILLKSTCCRVMERTTNDNILSEVESFTSESSYIATTAWFYLIH